MSCSIYYVYNYCKNCRLILNSEKVTRESTGVLLLFIYGAPKRVLKGKLKICLKLTGIKYGNRIIRGCISMPFNDPKGLKERNLTVRI